MICPAATGTNFSMGTSGLRAFSRFSQGTNLVNRRAEAQSLNLSHGAVLWCQIVPRVDLPADPAQNIRPLPSFHVTAITDKPALEE